MKYLKELLMETVNQDYEGLLYHYTDMHALKGMAESFEIWATRYDYLNDPTEFVHGIDIFKSAIEKHLPDYKALLEFMDEEKNNLKIPFYVVSLSEEKDLLSQWRGYGDNCSGYSIGFKIYQECETKPFIVGKVDYDDVVKLGIAERVVLKFKSLIASVNNEDDQNDCMSSFIQTVFMTAALFKDKSWEEEQEWRILLYHDTPGDLSACEFRMRSNCLIPFKKIEIKSGEIEFKELLFGPKVSIHDLQKNAVRLLMKKSNIGISFHESTVRIR